MPMVHKMPMGDHLPPPPPHSHTHIHTHTHMHTRMHKHTKTNKHILVIPPNRGRYETQCVQSVYNMQSGSVHYDVQHAIGYTLCMSMTVH